MDKTKLDETVKEAIELLISTAYEDGYADAKKAYKPDYKKILKKGRKQGFIITVIALGVAAYFYVTKKKPEPKIEHVQYVHDEEFEAEIVDEAETE